MKIIDKLKTQKETLAMAKYFAEKDEAELSFLEKALGVLSAILIYGIGIAFGVYLIFGFLTQ
jgi:hypothetical protein